MKFSTVDRMGPWFVRFLSLVGLVIMFMCASNKKSDSQVILEKVCRISTVMASGRLPGGYGYDIMYSGIIDSTFCLSLTSKYVHCPCYYPLRDTEIYCQGRLFRITSVDPDKISFTEVKE
jgi:hypothetical protein